MASTGCRLVTRVFPDLSGRAVTVHVPSSTAEAVVYAGDGQRLAAWGADLERIALPPTMVVGVHSATDETVRLQEYSAGTDTPEFHFDPRRFAAHQRFLLDAVRPWIAERFGVDPAAARTAILGVSAGAELALATGLARPDRFGAVLAASPGAGYRPPAPLPRALPRTYLLAGTQEPFFLEQAVRWAGTLRAAGADVVLRQRPGRHGGGFWRAEFPRMAAWAFGRRDPSTGSPSGTGR